MRSKLLVLYEPYIPSQIHTELFISLVIYSLLSQSAKDLAEGMFAGIPDWTKKATKNVQNHIQIFYDLGEVIVTGQNRPWIHHMHEGSPFTASSMFSLPVCNPVVSFRPCFFFKTKVCQHYFFLLP